MNCADVSMRNGPAAELEQDGCGVRAAGEVWREHEAQCPEDSQEGGPGCCKYLPAKQDCHAEDLISSGCSTPTKQTGRLCALLQGTRKFFGKKK